MPIKVIIDSHLENVIENEVNKCLREKKLSEKPKIALVKTI